MSWSDRLGELAVFRPAGAEWADACPNGDLVTTSPQGCGGDNQINLDDILAVLDSFADDPPCPDPCP